MANFTLKDIQFIGYADGETEAESKEYNFVDLFYTGNFKYEDIIKPTKFIISGRKGTGKTILAKYAEFEQKNINGDFFETLYIKLPDDIKNHEFIERTYYDITQDEYKQFTKYYILKKIANIIISKKIKFLHYIFNYPQKINLFKKYKNYKNYKKSYKYLKNIVLQRYSDKNYITSDFSKEHSNSINAKNSIAELSLCDNQKINYKIKNYNSIIETIEPHIVNCLQILNIMLIFDDIDDIKNYISDVTQLKKFLIGFIKSIRDVNIKIKKISNKNKCIVIIRDDILNNLNTCDSNLNKIIIDANVNLDWIGNNQTDTLFEMISNKIKKSNPKFKDLPNNQVLSIFIKDKSIKDKIIENSFGRPRDIINYLNLIVTNNPTEKSITYKMLKKENNAYSNRFWDELKNELFFTYSEGYTKEIELLLSSFGKCKFKYSELEEFYSLNKDNYKFITDIYEFTNNLYEFGIIGNQKKINKTFKTFFLTEVMENLNFQKMIT